MANEAVLRQKMSNPIDWTVADATAVTKGAICKMTDPRTAILSDGGAQPVAGIAARDKVASDGRTNLAFYYDGIFDVVASGAINLGAWCETGDTGSLNYVQQAKIFTSGGAPYVSSSGAQLLGKALETASDNETFQMRLML